MFESGYTRELIDMGYRDAMARGEEIVRFLNDEDTLVEPSVQEQRA
jgi:hypothetical protein